MSNVIYFCVFCNRSRVRPADAPGWLAGRRRAWLRDPL